MNMFSASQTQMSAEDDKSCCIGRAGCEMNRTSAQNGPDVELEWNAEHLGSECRLVAYGRSTDPADWFDLDDALEREIYASVRGGGAIVNALRARGVSRGQHVLGPTWWKLRVCGDTTQRREQGVVRADRAGLPGG
jgi:hypothetical protein